ncbi:MAG TPA: MFS transporter, partial [Bdellovibrionales bacterium]|nr:MFS transporter [Bdellovibrionales bacterium]
FEVITEYFRRPVIGPLLWVSFLSIFAFAQMESVLFLLVHDRFGWSMSTAAFGFAYVGLVSAFTQGFLVRRLLPKVGERPVMFWGLMLSALGLALIGFSPDPYVMAVVVTVMSIGVGLRNPSLLGSISVKAGDDEQGAVMGVSQSLASLGRILGPPLGGLLYAYWVPAPFIAAGLITLMGLVIVWRIYGEIPDHALVKKKPAAPVTPRAFQSAPVNEATMIGEYQLKNLLRQRVPMLFVDLRPPGSAPEFPQAVHTSETTLLEDVSTRVPDRTFPVVIVCATGEESLRAADRLIRNEYLNVVVLKGGTGALGS